VLTGILPIAQNLGRNVLLNIVEDLLIIWCSVISAVGVGLHQVYEENRSLWALKNGLLDYPTGRGESHHVHGIQIDYLRPEFKSPDNRGPTSGIPMSLRENPAVLTNDLGVKIDPMELSVYQQTKVAKLA